MRRVGVAGAIAAWFAVIAILAAAPVFAPDTALAIIARVVFSGLCHQIPERSFAHDGHLLAVCARCAGIYAGLALGPLLAIAHPLAPRRARWWLVGAVPMATQVVLAWIWPALDLGWLRALTGIWAGLFGGWLLASALSAPRETLDRAPASA